MSHHRLRLSFCRLLRTRCAAQVLHYAIDGKKLEYHRAEHGAHAGPSEDSLLAALLADGFAPISAVQMAELGVELSLLQAEAAQLLAPPASKDASVSEAEAAAASRRRRRLVSDTNHGAVLSARAELAGLVGRGHCGDAGKHSRW